ncbi:MAG: hypothetical protein HRU41_23355 [Saprospiraceae bacterium]|nr:hypothetical protein [Saprospiraceae bacterium]
MHEHLFIWELWVDNLSGYLDGQLQGRGITHLLTPLISPADGWCFPPPSLLDTLISPDMSQVKIYLAG